jgi:hypothetical protein
MDLHPYDITHHDITCHDSKPNPKSISFLSIFSSSFEVFSQLTLVSAL